jgi:hypothetical protein
MNKLQKIFTTLTIDCLLKSLREEMKGCPFLPYIQKKTMLNIPLMYTKETGIYTIFFFQQLHNKQICSLSAFGSQFCEHHVKLNRKCALTSVLFFRNNFFLSLYSESHTPKLLLEIQIQTFLRTIL